MVKGLEEISERFPYFQNAHILLAKQYHGHENIRYESYIKKAAAYAGNRDLLFRLINTQPPEIIHMRKEEPETATPAALESSIPSKEPIVQTFMEAVRDDKPAHDTGNGISAENFSAQPEHPTVNDEPVIHQVSIIEENNNLPADSENEKDLYNAREIIERRLQEIEHQSQFERKSEPIEQIEPPNSTIEISSSVQEKTGIPVIDDTIYPVSEKEENATANSTDVEEQPVPISQKAGETRLPSGKEVHSFLDWLKIKNAIPVPVEKPLEFFSEKEAPPPASDNLLDKFIKNEPRIVPQRAEFYSPGNMARKSLEVHDDLITETLAKIYAGQGHLTEAIESYRKLSLKYPEKSGYFAARISELEEEIRNKE
jgi:hypothetical protein